MLSRVVFFLLGVCGVVYLRSVPLQAIPEKFQDRVESAIPPWLNSSMHLLNGLPALNTTHFNGPSRMARSDSRRDGARGWATPPPPRRHRPRLHQQRSPELWEGLKCGKHFFRQRMRGTPRHGKGLLTDRQCWMQHMRLDPITGLDPPGIKLAPSPASRLWTGSSPDTSCGKKSS